jgi:hypothetical protein
MRRLLWIATLLCAVVSTASGQKVAKLTEDLRLDATKEDFPRVSSVAVGPKEQIVVLVPNEMNFRVYDSTGRKLGAFGRVGSGPGEFRSPGSIGWTADTIWVFDYNLRRFSWFGPDMKLLRTEPLPPPKMPGVPTPEGNLSGVFFMPSVLMPDGSLLGSGNVAKSAQRGQPWENFVGIQAPSGDVTKLPMSPNFEDPRWDMFHAGFSRSVPFTVRPQVAMTNGSRMGLMTIENGRDGGTISVTTYGLGGWLTGRTLEEKMKVELSKKIQFKGEPIPSSVRDSVMAAFVPPPGRPTEGPADLPLKFQAMAKERMPSFYNPVESLLLGLDKTVWLLRPTRNDRWSADVYDGHGNLLGRVEPPYKTRIRHGTATHVWTTQRDEDDLISIVRYRIEWAK